jgi:hypothetical protein
LINFEALAEKRILEAIERGDLAALPGSGRPLELEEDKLVPAEVRVANRILKNAGLAPPEILERRELAALEADLAERNIDNARLRTLGRIALLRTQLEARKARRSCRTAAYAARLAEKLAR